MDYKNEDIVAIAKRIENKDFQYIGLFLTDQSRNYLLNVVEDIIPQDARIYLEHCTLLHKTQLMSDKAEEVKTAFFNAIEHNDMVVDIKIVRYGKSDKAMAFGIECNAPSCNHIKHITICTYNGGKPFESNQITDWVDFDVNVTIKGVWKII